MQKIPFMVIAGEEDMKSNAVSFRYRNGDQKNGIPIAQAIAEIHAAITSRAQV
jgi:threonyl-tRNA synthetase